MNFTPETDGLDHINIYSKGKTDLGRFLSNFIYFPLALPEGEFKSIEGYWYYLGCQDDRLMDLWGKKAKDLGKKLTNDKQVFDPEFVLKIMAAIQLKIIHGPYCSKFFKTDIPLTHYYYYGTKVIQLPEFEWIPDLLMKFRDKYRNNYWKLL